MDIEALARGADAGTDALPTPTTDRRRVVYGRIQSLATKASEQASTSLRPATAQIAALTAQMEARRKAAERWRCRLAPLRCPRAAGARTDWHVYSRGTCAHAVVSIPAVPGCEAGSDCVDMRRQRSPQVGAPTWAQRREAQASFAARAPRSALAKT